MGQPVDNINLRALWCERTTGHRFDEHGAIRATLWVVGNKQITAYRCRRCQSYVPVQERYVPYIKTV